MAENLLYLCPKDYSLVPADPAALLTEMKLAGFLGDTIEFDGEEHYRPGEEFLSLVTFLGCSPVIAMGEPGTTGEGFCHIAVEGPYQAPRFIAGDNIKIPRCPGCGHRFDSWQNLTEQWVKAPEKHFECPECSRRLQAPELRWRKCAGFGRYFIKIWGIFESEAVPNPNLLSLLEKHSGTTWQHFYVREQ